MGGRIQQILSFPVALCLYLFKNGPSQFSSHWESAEPVFCSEELSSLPCKNQNKSLTLSYYVGKFKFAVFWRQVFYRNWPPLIGSMKSLLLSFYHLTLQTLTFNLPFIWRGFLIKLFTTLFGDNGPAIMTINDPHSPNVHQSTMQYYSSRLVAQEKYTTRGPKHF